MFAGGELGDPEAVLDLLRKDDLVVAANGGTRHCRLLGLIPSVLVGDLDSANAADLDHVERYGTTISRFPVHKDRTDLELALAYACSLEPTDVLVFGAFGLRWDHTLANVLLLLHPDFAGTKIALCDGQQTLQIVRDQLKLVGVPGDLLSLLPLSEEVRGVSASGLEYTLRNRVLHRGTTLGVSNRFTGSRVELKVRSGVVLVGHARVGERPRCG
ncbi:MAG: thiamine diphosphokinase [Deltaproteobacteria bacterium RIFOXYA12_FULL_61_11]|nr:MAG: thiamine diphosphokinase [Deltaproteobacteria bacterium RIFOXYA12_FULL_61_11]